MKHIISMAVAGLMLAGGQALADDGASYEVTITNLTRGTVITPVLVASHAGHAGFFQLGQPPSDALAHMAEGGDTSLLQADLAASGRLYDAASTAGAIPPGQSASVTVKTLGHYDRISLAGMLVPTNDGFISLQNVRAPKGRHALTRVSPGYDAGSEVNDELCANIPGPYCGGEGYNPAPGEGVVFIHAGIHGGGDLAPADFDWRNPVAKVVIKRMAGDDH